MTIKSIMVQLELDNFSPALVTYADNLRKRFDAELIGFSACDLQSTFVSIDGTVVDGEMVAAERKQIETQMSEIEDRFREMTVKSGRAEWRGFVNAPTPALCREARAADLVITGSTSEPGIKNYARTIDLGELVLGAGRPVIIAGAGISELKAENILVGCKDTRESRRAVIDALPFLTLAKQVIVTTLDDPSNRTSQLMLKDVVEYLVRHDCKVASKIHPDEGDSGQRLHELALQMNADMIVTGAFGHSRLREWAFGGVTRTLLGARNISRFMSN